MRAHPARRAAGAALLAGVFALAAGHTTAGELEGLFKRAAQRIKDEAVRKAEDRVVQTARQPLQAVEQRAPAAGDDAARSASPIAGARAGTRYDAPRADTRLGNVPQSLWLELRRGGKFGPMEGPPAQVVAVNPYLDPQRPFFGTMTSLQCARDGSLVVAGEGGLDPDGETRGAGWWKIAADGAIASFVSRPPATASPVRHQRPFSLAPDGSLLATTDDGVVRVAADGTVRALATGLDMPGTPVLDPHGNLWVSDDNGCQLSRYAPDGSRSLVVPRERGICGALPPPERVNVEQIAWDPVHGELVAGGGYVSARPVHDLHSSLWRIRPDGQARRVYYTVKAGRSPVGQNIDTIWAVAVDARGRIVVGTRLLDDEARRQVARLDEARGRLEVLTGQSFAIRHSGAGDYRPGHEEAPYDGPAAHANFRETKNLCHGPDGTLFVLDEHQVRRFDTDGMVRTWAY